MHAADLLHQPVSVIGAARSGIAVARLLQSHGAVPFLSDANSSEKLLGSVQELEQAGIEYELGGHTERVYRCVLMVISPGVPSTAAVIVEAMKRSIPVASEVEVASWYCSAPIVAITGSNGKTTTTTLIGRILSDARKHHQVAGNIGTAFSSVVDSLQSQDTAILEISSFQLDHCSSFKPHIAVILNITQNHMDRYDHSMQHYAESKSRIFMNQSASDVLIYNQDDEWTQRMVQNARCKTIGFSLHRPLAEGAWIEHEILVTALHGKRTEIIKTQEISIQGPHNLYNAMASTLTAQLMGVRPASIRATLRNFKGVEHRQEFVREVNGIKFYNDSKATSVDAVWYALQSFQQPIVLMLGGRDKGNDYGRIAPLVQEHVRAIVAMGESAEKVEQSFASIKPVQKASSIDEAVLLAQRLAVKGDVVLLSPACASFDWFENYEQRGKVFKELVKNLE